MADLETAFMFRTSRSDQGTEGFIIVSGFFCYTLELPWRENKPNISCIPAGEYLVETRQSPKYGLIYHVTNVQDRTFILMHAGNLAGDVAKGWRTNVNGCILLGKKMGTLYIKPKPQRAVLTSKPTVRKFMKHLNYQSFNLKIMEAF